MHAITSPERGGLGQQLAEHVGASSVVYEREAFPDGERYVRIEADLHGEVALVADLRPHDAVVEALLAADAAREAGAATVTLLVPYLAYARQDRAFNPGEAVSSRAVLHALASAADALATVDVHNPRVLSFFQGPAVSEQAAPEIADVLGQRSVDLVLAPDAGARDRAGAVAGALGCPSDHLEKTRISSTEVQMKAKELDVSGATVAIVDDIISTGGTMATATGQLLEAGADRVLVAATHGLFVSGADKRLDEAGVDEVLVADTIVTDRSVIPCAGALARGWQQAREA